MENQTYEAKLMEYIRNKNYNSFRNMIKNYL